MTKPTEDQQRQPWFDQRDCIGVLGLSLVGYGSWLVFPPAGFVVPGAILCWVAIFGVRG